MKNGNHHFCSVHKLLYFIQQQKFPKRKSTLSLELDAQEIIKKRFQNSDKRTGGLRESPLFFFASC